MDFKESEHPRDRDGKFTDGNGSYSDGVNERIEWAKENGIELPLSSDGSVDDLKLQEIYDSTKNKNGKNKDEIGKDVKSQSSPEDKTTIKEQIVAGLDKIKDTKPVATISKAEITTDINKAISSLREKLSKNGGVVVRNGFGDIQVGSRLKDAVAYIKTPAEIAAFSAVPAVIENGVLIDEHKSHKGRGYPSYLFAGKVSIGAQEGIVAVAVKKTTGNFYKVHRVLTPDGKDLKIEKDID